MFANPFGQLYARTYCFGRFGGQPEIQLHVLVGVCPGNQPWREPLKEGYQPLSSDEFTFALVFTADCN